MSDLQSMLEDKKVLHISGIEENILSPIEWIKKVQGIALLDYLHEEGVSLTQTTQLMEWYGEYVGKKVKKCCK